MAKSPYQKLKLLYLKSMLLAIKSVGTSYYVASRDFELPEIKLLVDSVQSSKFITLKKTMMLIRDCRK